MWLIKLYNVYFSDFKNDMIYLNKNLIRIYKYYLNLKICYYINTKYMYISHTVYSKRLIIKPAFYCVLYGRPCVDLKHKTNIV